jgi:hypothetical protein
MPIPVEINLRIPEIKDPLKDSSGWPIPNADIRFFARMELPALPKPGDVIDLKTAPDYSFQATVLRTDWRDDKDMFVVSCKYSNRSIPRDEYLALTSDSGWTAKPLLA